MVICLRSAATVKYENGVEFQGFLLTLLKSFHISYCKFKKCDIATGDGHTSFSFFTKQFDHCLEKKQRHRSVSRSL